MRNNKSKLQNIIMVVIIIIIMGMGICTAGRIRGWFDEKNPEKSMMITDVKGLVNITRKGITFSIEKNHQLHSGDILEVKDGSGAEILFGNNRVVLDENTTVKISDKIYIESGKIYAETESLQIAWRDDSFVAENNVFCLNVLIGSANCYIFSGKIKEVSEGNKICYIGDQTDIEKLRVEELADFEIMALQDSKKGLELCFSRDELKNTLASRHKQTNVIMKETTAKRNEVTQKDTEANIEISSGLDTNKETQNETSGETIIETVSISETSGETQKPKVTRKETQKTTYRTETTAKVTSKETHKNTVKATTGDTQKETEKETEKPTADIYKCIIKIQCVNILDHLDELKTGKDRFVPDDGIIVNSVEVEFAEGETVFDVLKRTCEYMKIPMEYSYAPMYGTHYIEGINNLYEKDCGDTSGWIYEVNSWRAPFGCSQYKLKQGDVILWSYVIDVTQ